MNPVRVAKRPPEKFSFIPFRYRLQFRQGPIPRRQLPVLENPHVKSVARLGASHSKEQSKDYFFVILSAAKNLSLKAGEILHSAALRSE